MQIFEVSISIVVSVLAVVLTIRYRMVDYFDNNRQKYSENTEKVYMELLKVYTSEDFEKEALNFTQSIFDKNLNTTYYGKYHVFLMSDRKDNRIYHMKYFKEFAEEIENRYWREFNNKYFKIIIADSPMKSIGQRVIKRIVVILDSIKFIQIYLLGIGILSFINSLIIYLFSDNTKYIDGFLLIGNVAVLISGTMQLILMLSRNRVINLIRKEIDHKLPQNFIKTQNIKMAKN